MPNRPINKGISKYDVRIRREYRPYFVISSKDPVFFDKDTCARLSIEIDFFDDDAAVEFEKTIIAMMPGREDG